MDDVDDDLEDFEKEDIRFGIDNVKDPFKLEEDQRQKVEELRLQEEQTKRAGEQIDVTGDGGVKKLVLHIGDGEVVEKGSRVTVTYVGKFEDGKVFDKSDDGFEFVLGGGKVIKGWEAGVAGMRVGEEAQFTIRADYAYGRRGMPPVIPSGATLVFDIEVIASVGGEEKDIRTVPEFNPDVARTPEQIQREYEGRLETQEERRKGMSLLDRFYIISPFASETGERPPWWINPNITFFLIAVGVSIGTYLLVIAGGVHVGYVDAPVDVNIFK